MYWIPKRKALDIASDLFHPLYPQFKMLPSGRCFILPRAIKIVDQKSFVPSAVKLLNTKLIVRGPTPHPTPRWICTFVLCLRNCTLYFLLQAYWTVFDCIWLNLFIIHVDCGEASIDMEKLSGISEAFRNWCKSYSLERNHSCLSFIIQARYLHRDSFELKCFRIAQHHSDFSVGLNPRKEKHFKILLKSEVLVLWQPNSGGVC